MGAPALKLTTGGTAVELTTHVGGSDFSESLNRDRAGVTHSRYGVPVASRTWKNAKIWKYNVNAASQSYMESLRAFFEAGSFYLYPDVDNTAEYYTVFWVETSFEPRYISPDQYSLRATFKETTIGAGTPVYIEGSGDQTVNGNLIVTGNHTVNGTLNASILQSGGTDIGSLFIPEADRPSLLTTGSSEYAQFLPVGDPATSDIMIFERLAGGTKEVTTFGSFPMTTEVRDYVDESIIQPGRVTSGTFTGETYTFAPTGGTAARRLFIDDSQMLFQGSEDFGWARGIIWASTGDTAETDHSMIGVRGNVGGGMSSFSHGFLGYGPTPYDDRLLTWYHSGHTNEGRLDVDADTLNVIGDIDAGGYIDAQSYIISRTNLWAYGTIGANYNAGSSDSTIYFHDGTDRTNGWLKLNTSSEEFTLSHPLNVASGTTPLTVGDANSTRTILRVEAPDTAGSGLGCAEINLVGYESRANGIFVFDDDVMDGMWFYGRAYNNDDFIINFTGTTDSNNRDACRANPLDGSEPYFTIKKSTGYVGINTNDPAAELDVAGTVSASSVYSDSITATSIEATHYLGLNSVKAGAIIEPQAGDEFTMWFTEDSITFAATKAVVRGTGSPTVTWKLMTADQRDAAGTIINSGTCNSTNFGNSDFTMENANVAGDQFIWVEIVSTGGTSVDEFSLTTRYNHQAL